MRIRWAGSVLATVSFLMALLFAVPAVAVEPMAGAEFTWTHIKIADETFNPPAARVRLALALTPAWEIGVLGGAGIADDTEVGVSVGMAEFAAGYVRYSASLDDNARLVMMVGYGETTLDVLSSPSGAPLADTYTGVIWGFSLQERLARYPNWIGSLDFERWFDDKGLTISTLSYGFRYEF